MYPVANPQKRIRNWILISLAAVMLLAVLAWLFLFQINRFTLEIVLRGGESMELDYGTEFTDPGARLRLRGTIILKDGLEPEGEIDTSGKVDTDTIGTYRIRYSASYGWWDAETVRSVRVVDREAPVITLSGEHEVEIAQGETYEETGFEAYDEYDGDLTDRVEIREQDGVITYTVADSSGNTATAVRTIRYVDHEPPVITLAGAGEITLTVGTAYTEPGYSATDACDCDVTADVVITGQVDTSREGTYVLTYTVSDRAGNTASVSRTVICTDPYQPRITLLGDMTLHIEAAAGYAEPGFRAEDHSDGDLTNCVVITGEVDPYHAGTYTLTYTVTDSNGNTDSVTRTVIVDAKPQPETVRPEGKVIYLTFDDGPGPYTQQLLDVLAEYDVQATFFVMNTDYAYLIGDIVAAGHAIGIHTTTHDYDSIYASEAAFFADLYGMQQIIYEESGVMTTLMRFPGGSSNTVSSFNEGIMTSLTSAVTDAGFQYFDWNVDSDDAGRARSPEVVLENVIEGTGERQIVIVLQHDIKDYSVEAVEDIIIWGLENGYTFLPLDPTSPTCHHGVNN